MALAENTMNKGQTQSALLGIWGFHGAVQERPPYATRHYMNVHSARDQKLKKIVRDRYCYHAIHSCTDVYLSPNHRHMPTIRIRTASTAPCYYELSHLTTLSFPLRSSVPPILPPPLQRFTPSSPQPSPAQSRGPSDHYPNLRCSPASRHIHRGSDVRRSRVVP